jgi:hypothetical protein
MTTKENAKTFTRVVNNEYFMSLIKEARRVKYQVTGEPNNFYKVLDGEELVFRGIFQGQFWITTFSTLYWRNDAT